MPHRTFCLLCCVLPLAVPRPAVADARGISAEMQSAQAGQPGASDHSEDPEAARHWRPRHTEEAIERLQRISASTMFGHCCFWAWELELAILKNDRDMAQRIALILGGLQRSDGRWGLGDAWGRGKIDFKHRGPEDAESWDVAEAACALLDYGETFGDATFLPHVRKAAAYLKTCIRYAGGKPYLPHMAECNNLLQPHSTINTALLFSRLPEYKNLAKELHRSGVAMNFFRLTPHEDLQTVDPPRLGQEVNDFEKAQIGYYLHLMDDPAGSRLMARYWTLSDFNHPRGGAYLVLAYAKLGQWDKARHFAEVMKDYQPKRGYEYALRDIIDYVNETAASQERRKTEISIRGEAFYLNGKPTYQGRTWKGRKIEGLLLNSRMVQGVFDDLNPETAGQWAYPDTGKWDPERNTREFLAAMPEWRSCGLLCFTINLQGGNPRRDAKGRQPWQNSAITLEGELRSNYMGRLEKILDRADELGMAVILGVFYFGQDERLKDEQAVTRALDHAVDWVYERGYRNVLIEVNNECNVRYDHAILKPDRVHELIERVKARRPPDGRRPRLLVSTSYGGGTVPLENVVRSADFLLMHGNGVSDPKRIGEMVRQCRQAPGYQPKPILFNEDDHFDFQLPMNNMTAALGEYASWGFFDPGQNDYTDGYQSPPVQWGLNTERKRAFFAKVREVAGLAAE